VLAFEVTDGGELATLIPRAAVALPRRATNEQVPMPVGLTVYVAGSVGDDGPEIVATGEQPKLSNAGAATAPAVLLTVNDCAAVPGPLNVSELGETWIEPTGGVVGWTTTVFVLPPPHAASEPESTAMSKAERAR
jgi:hypothetical protein